MKPISLLLGLFSLAAALFYSGWHYNPGPLASDTALFQPTVDRHVQELSSATSLLDLLDHGDTTQLRERLQSQMFLALLDLDSLSDVTDAHNRQLTRSLAKQIAKHRAAGSPSFAGLLNHWPADSNAQFDALLKRTATAPANPQP